MPLIHFDYYKSGEKKYVRHHVDISVDGEVSAHYEAAKKTDLSTHIYAFYERLGIGVKPVFDGVDFPDCKANESQLLELKGSLSDFRVWRKSK